jgi:hypothetical protein
MRNYFHQVQSRSRAWTGLGRRYQKTVANRRAVDDIWPYGLRSRFPARAGRRTSYLGRHAMDMNLTEWTCPKCAAENEADFTHCRLCGLKNPAIPEDCKKCAKCGSLTTYFECHTCGSKEFLSL